MEHFSAYLLAGGFCLLALVLVAVELFLPSHGILGVFAFIFAMGGVGVAYYANPIAGVLLGIVVLISAPFVIYFAIKIYPNTAVGKRIILGKPQTDPNAGYEQQARTLSELVGQKGIALSSLRPSGQCEINNHRVDAVAESGLIDAQTPVEVVQVKGLIVIVRKITSVT